MSESDTGTAGAQCPVVQFAPPDIARRQIAAWNGVQTEAVELTRREPFEYGFKARCHLLIMSALAERDDGETRIEGLPKSTLQEFSHKLSLVPSGHEYVGWQMPRELNQATYCYIDPRGSLADPQLRIPET